MDYYQYTFKAMGSPCCLHFYASSESQATTIYQLSLQLIHQLESTYSRFISTSLVSQINQNAGRKSVQIDPQTYALLVYADQAFQISDGLFDITTGVLRHAWDFKQAKLPNYPPALPRKYVTNSALCASVSWPSGCIQV